jgi:hypothetical protein
MFLTGDKIQLAKTIGVDKIDENIIIHSVGFVPPGVVSR